MNDEPTMTLSECREFVAFYAGAVCSPEGSVKPLRAFAHSNPTPVGQAVRCWFDGLVSGLSYAAALQRCRLRFPVELESLIVLGCERSSLDIILSDVRDVFESERDETLVREKLANVLRKRRDEKPPTFVCVGCLEDELAALFTHALAAGANEVIIDWNDGLMTQVFLGPKAVRLSVAASRLVFDTMGNFLHTDATNATLRIRGQELRVEPCSEAQKGVVLRLGEVALTVRFA